MADIITRVYGSHENAQAAIDELKAYRFDDAAMTVVAYLGGFKTGSNAAAAEFNEIVDAVAAGYVPKAEAAIYALSIARGATLVTVRAPFGTGGRAMTILDSHDPIETGVPPKEYAPLRQWDEATPASSFLSMRVLLDDTVTLSAVLGIPILWERSRTVLSALRLPELLNSSNILGIPAIIRGTPSVTALLGLPVLTDAKARLSSILHIRLLLSHDASFSAFCDMGWLRPLKTPLSSALHIPTLTKDTTSLSGLAGLPTLSGNTLLSSVLGIPTLVKSKFLRS